MLYIDFKGYKGDFTNKKMNEQIKSYIEKEISPYIGSGKRRLIIEEKWKMSGKIQYHEKLDDKF